MVRRKIEIKLIEDKSKRHTTFTKRRKGLMKKTEEFCRKSDSSAALIAFSNAGNCYALGHPDVDSVLDCYDGESSSASVAEAPSSSTGERVHGGDDEEEAATEVEKRIGAAVETGRWEEAVRGLGLQELHELFAEIENIKCKVEEARARKIAAAVVGESKVAVAEKEEESESSGGDSSC